MRNIWKRSHLEYLVALAALPVALGCHGPGHGAGNMSEAALVEHFEDVAEYGLDYVDADERQAEQVNRVIAGVVPDLVRFRHEQRGLSARLRAELAKNPVDRAKIEALRQEALGLVDRASARGAQALLSAADALTPEQRKKLTDRWEKHRR